MAKNLQAGENLTDRQNFKTVAKLAPCFISRTVPLAKAHRDGVDVLGVVKSWSSGLMSVCFRGRIVFKLL